MKSLLAVAFLLISTQTFAYDQTFESCSLTAWSIFENLQQYQLHVPLEKLKATKCKDGVPKYATECSNIDTAYSMAKSEGIDTAYIAAHVHYIKCSGEVQSRVGRGPLPQLESAYRECARSSGARANILAAIKQGTPIEVTRDKMGAPYYDLIDTLYRKARDTNLTSVLDDSARAAMACIEAVEATERSSSEQSPDKTKKVLADRLDAAASGQPLVKEGGSAKTAMSAEHSWELRGLRLGDDVQTALSRARAIGPGSEFIPRKDPDLPGTIASLWKLGDDLCGWAAATPCERYKLMFSIEPSNSRLFRIDLIQSFGSKGVSSKEVISNLRTALGKESRYTTTSSSFGDKTVLLTWSEKPLPPNMQITAMTVPVDFTQGGKVAVAELHYRLGSDRLQGITFYLMDLDLMLENLQRAKDIGLLPGTPKPNTHF
jgi:hypothetical protein